jgi:glycosyltransferase involved in cell wall biosynthesis
MQSGTIRRQEGGRRIRGDIRAEQPLVSIIMVVFRAREELKNLLDNVFGLDTSGFELIVVDGGSQDGTVELLRYWDEKIDYWVSEPDSGIYDAMNKGIAAAQGEYILHLNEGDRLTSLPHEALAMCLAQGVDVASFPVITEGEIFYPRTGFLLRIVNTWHHQGTFYRRSRELGYDARYRAMGDFDLNQRLFKSGKTVRLFDQVVSCHRNDGISAGKIALRELYRTIRKNFGTPYVVLAFLRFKYLGLRQRAQQLAARLVPRTRKP